jgi:hypothetical protein
MIDMGRLPPTYIVMSVDCVSLSATRMAVAFFACKDATVKDNLT